MVPLTTIWAAWTSPSMRACSETTSVPGCSGSAATLPRTAPTTRSPPLRNTLPSMRVVAPIRLSMRFCGLLSLRNMTFAPSLQSCDLRRLGVGGAAFVDAHLHAFHLGLGTDPESAFSSLEVLEVQAKCRRLRLPGPRHHAHSIPTGFRQTDHELEAPLEIAAAPRTGREQKHPVTKFARNHIGLDLEAQDRERRRTGVLRRQHAFEDRQFLAQPRIVLLERPHLLCELLLRSALDRYLAVGGVGGRAQPGKLVARRSGFAPRRRKLLFDLAAIEAREAPPGVVHPRGERRGKREQHRDAEPAQVPR